MWLFNTARRKNQSKYGKLYFIEHSSEYWLESFYLNSHTNLYIHGHFKLLNMKLHVLMIKLTHWAWVACDPAEVKKFASWMEEIVIKTTAYLEERNKGPWRRNTVPFEKCTGSYIPRCKISFSSRVFVVSSQKCFRFCFPLAWRLSVALFRLLSIPRPWPPLTQAQMSPRDLSRAIVAIAPVYKTFVPRVFIVKTH